MLECSERDVFQFTLHKSVFCSCVNHIQLTDNEAAQQIRQEWGRKRC